MLAEVSQGSEMREWVKNGRCNRECFANHEGMCRALAEVPKKGKCSFQRTDITMQGQYADITLYNSHKSLKDYDVGING